MGASLLRMVIIREPGMVVSKSMTRSSQSLMFRRSRVRRKGTSLPDGDFRGSRNILSDRVIRATAPHPQEPQVPPHQTAPSRWPAKCTGFCAPGVTRVQLAPLASETQTDAAHRLALADYIRSGRRFRPWPQPSLRGIEESHVTPLGR